MKCWIVPSSLFIPGRLMSPIRILRERDGLVARKAQLEAELAALPGKIAENERRYAELGTEYVPFKDMEKK